MPSGPAPAERATTYDRSPYLSANRPRSGGAGLPRTTGRRTCRQPAPLRRSGATTYDRSPYLSARRPRSGGAGLRLQSFKPL